MFPKFQKYACEGDSVTVAIDGFTLTAKIYRDDNPDNPDERQDGFYPSLDPKSAGYIGPKSKRTLARHMAKAERVMQAWKNDEWFYCGIAVTVERNGVQLTHEFANALWGVACNYPDSDNSYLCEVANELTADALIEARNVLETLLESVA